MSAPITWRNLDASSPSGSFAGMSLAQQGINQGLQQLRDVLKQQQDTDNANWNVVKENNTNAFLNRLASTRTPEEMVALQASGELDNMRAAFGAQMDAARVRDAEDTRLGVLQNRGKTAIDYKNTVRDDQEAPVLDAIKAADLRGDITTAARLRAENPDLSKKALLEENLRKITRENVSDTQAATAAQDKHVSSGVTDNYHRALTGQASAQTRKIEADIKDASDQSQTLKRGLETIEAARKGTLLEGGTLNSSSGQKTLLEGLAKLKVDPGTLQDIMTAVNKKYPNGEFTTTDSQGNKHTFGIPASVLLSAIEGRTESKWSSPFSSPHFFNTVPWQEDQVTKQLDNFLSNPGNLALLAADEQTRNNVVLPAQYKTARSAGAVLSKGETPVVTPKERKSAVTQLLGGNASLPSNVGDILAKALVAQNNGSGVKTADLYKELTKNK